MKSRINIYASCNLVVDSRKYSLNYQWFDSSDSSSYNKFYWNKIKVNFLVRKIILLLISTAMRTLKKFVRSMK